METPTCSICLGDLDSNTQYLQTLSCGHVFHFQCFKRLVYRSNLFIKCPLCREINMNTEKPSEDDFKNLQLLSSQRVGKIRCCAKTKNGTCCKRKSKHFNYGYCSQHHKETLKPEQYPLFVNYIYLILKQHNTWKSKVTLIDIGKQFIIKYPNRIKGVEDILHFFYEYLSVCQNESLDGAISKQMVFSQMYEHYNLEPLNENWFSYCCKNHILI